MQPTFRAYLFVSIFAVIVSLIASRPEVQASQESDLAYSLGVQSLTALRYGEALDHFNQVARLDPANVKGRYYQAVAREKLNQDAEALAILENLTAHHPSYGEAWFLRGMLRLKTKQATLALTSLAQAVSLMPKSANAHYYRGMAEQGNGKFDKSLQSFAKAASLDPKLSLAALYFSGVAYLGLNDTAHAIENLEAVKQRSPGIGFGVKAEELLKSLDKPAESRPPLSASVSLGFEYDSNVLLEPDSIEISDEDDFRGVVFVGGRLRLSAAALTYSLYQSQHLQLDEFNVQSHRLMLEVAPTHGEAKKAFDYGVRISPSLTLISNSLSYYSLGGYIEPYLLRQVNDHYTFGGQFKVQHIDFRSTDDIRDNVGYGASFNHLLQFFEHRFFLGVKGGLQFEDADREYDLFRMNGEAQLGLEWLTLFWNATGGLERTVYNRNASNRQDHRLTAGGGVSKKFGPLTMSGSFQFSQNDSNLAQFTYLRDIVSINLAYAF